MAEIKEKFDTFLRTYRDKKMDSLVPVMFLLNLQGKPYSLENHYQFEYAFNFPRPKRTVIKCARQVGKTYSVVGSNILTSWLLDYYRTLYVLPRFEQTKRLSNEVYRPFIDQSGFKKHRVDANCAEGINYRSFSNGSDAYFSFAFLDAGRIRGISGVSDIKLDESFAEGTLLRIIREAKISSFLAIWNNEGLKKAVSVSAIDVPIQEIRPRDLVETYTNDGYIIFSPTKTGAIDKQETRHCFRLTTASGRQLEVTADHRIPTTQGILRIEDIIEYAKQSTRSQEVFYSGSVGSFDWNSIGGRAYQSTRDFSDKSLYTSKRLPPIQIPDITRVLSGENVERRDCKTKISIHKILVKNFTGIQIFTRGILSSRNKDSGIRCVTNNHRESNSVVGFGRWIYRNRWKRISNTYKQFFKSRSEYFNRLVKYFWNKSYTQYGKKKKTLGICVSMSDFYKKRIGISSQSDFKETSSIFGYDLQNKVQRQWKLFNLWKKNFLRLWFKEKNLFRRMFQEIYTELASKLLQHSSYERSDRNSQEKRTKKEEIRSSYFGAKSATETTVEGMGTEISGENQSSQTEIFEKTTYSQEFFSGLDYAGVVEDSIVSIEYIGQRHIYDINVVGTHTVIASGICALQCADVNWEFIPIIEETTSAVVKHGYISYSGTPKTLDNTLTELWKESSMAEWVTKCEACNYYNIPTLEHDVLKMIGKDGVICASCGRPIDCSKGVYVHAEPSKRSTMSGYHIPQIVHPVHYRYPHKWQDVLYKMKVYPQSKFYNEVLGLECDSSMKMITREQLHKACIPEMSNTLEHAISLRRLYPLLVMGIDWGGGGGEDSVSYTSGAVGGVRPGSDVIETIYAFKLSRYLQPMEETAIIKELFVKFNPTFLAHDFGGAGALRETLLVQAGIPEDRLVPYTYILSPSKAVISFNSPDVGFRSSYSIDKTRSLLILCEMIKARKIMFPKWETVNTTVIDGSNITLLQDFEHLYQDVIERSSGSDLVRIATSAKKSDDFVHATNYLCSTIWYSMQKYPNLAEANQLRLTVEDIENISPIYVPAIKTLTKGS